MWGTCFYILAQKNNNCQQLMIIYKMCVSHYFFWHIYTWTVQEMLYLSYFIIYYPIFINFTLFCLKMFLFFLFN